jgi:hypothetical protein
MALRADRAQSFLGGRLQSCLLSAVGAAAVVGLWPDLQQDFWQHISLTMLCALWAVASACSASASQRMRDQLALALWLGTMGSYVLLTAGLASIPSLVQRLVGSGVYFINMAYCETLFQVCGVWCTTVTCPRFL